MPGEIQSTRARKRHEVTQRRFLRDRLCLLRELCVMDLEHPVYATGIPNVKPVEVAFVGGIMPREVVNEAPAFR